MRKIKVMSIILTDYQDEIFSKVISETIKQMTKDIIGEVIEDVGFDIETKIKVHHKVDYYVDGLQESKNGYQRAFAQKRIIVGLDCLLQQKHTVECEYIVEEYRIPQITPLKRGN